jgi:hypothetical protein
MAAGSCGLASAALSSAVMASSGWPPETRAGGCCAAAAPAGPAFGTAAAELLPAPKACRAVAAA